MFVCPRNAPSMVNPVNYDKTKLHEYITCTPSRLGHLYFHKKCCEIHKNHPSKMSEYIAAVR